MAENMGYVGGNFAEDQLEVTIGPVHDIPPAGSLLIAIFSSRFWLALGWSSHDETGHVYWHIVAADESPQHTFSRESHEAGVWMLWEPGMMQLVVDKLGVPLGTKLRVSYG